MLSWHNLHAILHTIQVFFKNKFLYKLTLMDICINIVKYTWRDIVYHAAFDEVVVTKYEEVLLMEKVHYRMMHHEFMHVVVYLAEVGTKQFCYQHSIKFKWKYSSTLLLDLCSYLITFFAIRLCAFTTSILSRKSLCLTLRRTRISTWLQFKSFSSYYPRVED